MFRLLKWSLLIVFVVGLLIIGWQLLFPAQATISDMSDYGPAPRLVKPVNRLLPAIRPAPAIGWQNGEEPSAADGLDVQAFASGLDHPRWLYLLPNGDVLVAEANAPKSSGMCNPVKNLVAGFIMNIAGAGTDSADRITLLRDVDDDGRADESYVFIDSLHSPFGMALIGDRLYVANADAVLQFPYRANATSISAAPLKIADLPSGRNHHWTKNIIASADGESLFVTVGSNSNVGECGPDVEVGRGAIHKLDLQSGMLEQFAHGLRNPNGMAFEPATGVLWTVVNERDEMGGDLVPDYITSVHPGDFFGWPQFYFGNNPQPKLDSRWPDNTELPRAPDYAVGSHTASLGLLFSYDSSLPEQWRHGLFVSQHGSWNRKPPAGYRVIYVPFENGMPVGEEREILSGFLNDNGKARGRPAGIVLDRKGALLIADDVGNIVWRVR